MCNLYSITTNQAAIIALFRVVNRYVGNLQPMPGVFPDYPAPVIRNTDAGTEMVTMRWGMPPPPRTGGSPVTNIRNTSSPHWRGWHRALWMATRHRSAQRRCACRASMRPRRISSASMLKARAGPAESHHAIS
jgi:putative SOS response-associated peptidase YedK